MKNILRNSNFSFKNRIMRMALLRSEPRKLNRSFGGLRASLLLALTAGWMGAAQAQVPFSNASYTFSTNGNVASFAYNGSPVANLTIGNIVKSSGITTGSSSGNFRASGWTTNSSLDASDYIGFTLATAPGQSLNLTSFNFGVGRSGTGTRAWAWYFSTNGFTNSAILTNYTSLAAGLTNTAGVLSHADDNSSWTNNVLSLSSLTNLTNAEFRLYSWSSEGSSGTAGLQGPFAFSGSIVSTGGGTTPTIITTGTLTPFSATAGTASAAQTFAVTGSNLTADVTVTAPAGFEVSQDGTSFASNQTLAKSGTTLDSKTISVRIAAGTAAGSLVSANVTLTSTGATTANVAVSGTVAQAGVAPTVTPATISGKVGASLSTNIVASQSPTSFAVATGTLPTGLSLNTTSGVITGTPSNAVSALVVSVTASNATGVSVPADLTFNIAKGDQAINGIADSNSKLTTDAPFTLPLNTSAGFPIFYSSLDSNVATVTGNTVTLVGAGSTVILAQQAGDNDWNAAPAVSQNLTVTVPPLTLTVNSAMTAFNAPSGSSSASQTFSLVGLSLSNDVVVTPPAGFEISSDGSSFGTNSLTLSKGGGNITNTISVRLPTNAPGGLLGGSILAVTDSNGTSVTRSTTVRGAVGVYWDFTSASPATNAVPQDWTLGPLTQGNNNGGAVTLITTAVPSGYTGASGTSNAGVAAQTGVFNPSNSAYFEIPIVVPDGDTNTLTDYGVRQVVFGSRSTTTGPVNYTIRSSADNYQSDLAMGSVQNDNNWSVRSNANVNLLLSKGTNTIRIYGYGSSSASQSGGSANWRIDDLVVTLGSIVNTDPTLSLLPSSITGLKAFTGSPSPSANYVVKGANLATNLNLQVSTNAIQISTDNTTFTNQLTLTPTTNGVLSNTVYVRLSSEAALGPVTGTVQNVSGSLTNTLSVAGTVYDAARGGSAATLAGWDVNDQIGGTGNFGPSPLDPTIKNSDVIVGGMTRGSGVQTSSTGAGRAWGGTTWEDANSVDAIANGKFVAFTLQATSGKTLSLTSLSKFNYRAAESYGPTSGLIQYQIGSGAFQDVAQVTYTRSGSGTGQTLSPVNLSGIQDLQNVPASQQVTFRIVNWGGSPNGTNPAFPGSWYIFDTANTPDIDFEVTGSVVDAVPADTTAPVITRIGNESIVVAWGDSYTDAGATVVDDVDSSVTVTSSGSVNTAVPGTYTITYNATDAANNNATPVTRTVTVSAPSSEVGADGLSGLLRYAFGANGPSDTVTKPTSRLSAGKLAITAIVRTNNPNLTVVGQAVTNLPNYASGTSIVGADVAADADQTNVTNGCERQTFSVEQGTDAKKFLRLKATLNP
jgi:trimeric autotransporter adhesin